jgi:hypothetical protein
MRARDAEIQGGESFGKSWRGKTEGGIHVKGSPSWCSGRMKRDGRRDQALDWCILACRGYLYYGTVTPLVTGTGIKLP